MKSHDGAIHAPHRLLAIAKVQPTALSSARSASWTMAFAKAENEGPPTGLEGV
jgi:hypothetical protein